MHLRHIDTCLACYLTDHHNRRGELLLGVEVDSAVTYQEVREKLLQAVHDFDGWDIAGSASGPLDGAAARAAVEEEFSGVPDLTAPFAPNLEDIEDDEDMTDSGIDDMGEACQAWFLFSWEAAE